MIEIRKYSKDDQNRLIDLLKKQNEEWKCYWHEDVVEKYKENLLKSITYVAYDNNMLCGFVRCIEDFGFYIYICDLLVDQSARGKSIGKQLMSYVKHLYPQYVVYVMSDVDTYYEKLNYHKEGSIFEVK